jgi:WD40 repeat protein
MYMSARFSPNGVQILTCGTDRKITYWETLDGSMIRELEGSGTGALNCIDITPDGKYFVTGGNDSIVKFWSYNSGETTHVGMGHAAIITSCKISPDGKHIVTVSADGAIMIWKSPFDMKLNLNEIKQEISTISSRSTCSIREEDFKNQLKLKSDDENVADFSPKSNTEESVKAVYKGINSIFMFSNYILLLVEFFYYNFYFHFKAMKNLSPANAIQLNQSLTVANVTMPLKKYQFLTLQDLSNLMYLSNQKNLNQALKIANLLKAFENVLLQIH